MRRDFCFNSVLWNDEKWKDLEYVHRIVFLGFELSNVILRKWFRSSLYMGIFWSSSAIKTKWKTRWGAQYYFTVSSIIQNNSLRSWKILKYYTSILWNKMNGLRWFQVNAKSLSLSGIEKTLNGDQRRYISQFIPHLISSSSISINPYPLHFGNIQKTFFAN